MVPDTWVGLSLGSTGMSSGTDMIQIDGENRVVYDKTSSGYQNPSNDQTDNLTDSYTFTENSSGSLLNVEIRRPLDTGDSNDYLI